MSVENTIPAGIVMARDQPSGLTRAIEGGVDAFDSDYSIEWGGFNLVTYAYTPALFGPGTGKQAKWLALMRDVKAGNKHFWVPEVFTETYLDLLCGPPGDGSRTTFPISCIDPTVHAVLLAKAGDHGSVVADTDFTAHASAQGLPTNDVINATDSTTGTEKTGTCTIARRFGVARIGLTCFEITPTGAQADVGLMQVEGGAYDAGSAAARIVTGCASVRGAGNFEIEIESFSDAALTANLDAETITSPVAGDTENWIDIAFTLTAPCAATSRYFRMKVTRATNSAFVFQVGALAINPGDYDRAHMLPCGGAIEHDSAPTKFHRTLVAATGRRISRCKMVKLGNQSWKIVQTNIVKHSPTQIVERAERAW